MVKAVHTRMSLATLAVGTGVPRPYESNLPVDPAVAPCLRTDSDPRGLGISYERDTPASRR